MLPILLALILQAMYGAVDLIIVGQFGTDSGISGVSTGSSIMNMFTFVTTSFATGVTVLIGRHLGSGQNQKIGKLIGGATLFFAIISVLLSVLLVIFARPIALLMQAPKEALDTTVTYIQICGGGFIFTVFYNFISGIFRGLGNSRLPLIFVGIACVVNIIGDLLLVAVFNMNVAGAAIATVAAQAVSVVLSLIIIRKQKLPFAIKRSDFCFNSSISQFVRIGIPLALQQFLTDASFLALCAFINRLGLAASSGYGIAQKIQSFIMLIPISIIQSMAPFVSQNVGANESDRARNGMKYGMLIGAGIGVIIAIFTFFFGDVLGSIFSNNSEYIAKSSEYLRGFSPECIITCILFSFLGYFNGYGKSMFVMIQGLAQSFLVRLPMSYIMSNNKSGSLVGVGLAAPSATVFGIILCIIYYIFMQKQLRKEHVNL